VNGPRAYCTSCGLHPMRLGHIQKPKLGPFRSLDSSWKYHETFQFAKLKKRGMQRLAMPNMAALFGGPRKLRSARYTRRGVVRIIPSHYISRSNLILPLGSCIIHDLLLCQALHVFVKIVSVILAFVFTFTVPMLLVGGMTRGHNMLVDQLRGSHVPLEVGDPRQPGKVGLGEGPMRRHLLPKALEIDQAYGEGDIQGNALTLIEIR
jgi:hypothetical protein